MSSFIGISSETGGAGCDVRLSCYCCYSRILTAFTQSHSSCLLLAAETIFAGWSERPKVSLGVQDSLDSVGRGGDNSRHSLLASPARYREG